MKIKLFEQPRLYRTRRNCQRNALLLGLCAIAITIIYLLLLFQKMKITIINTAFLLCIVIARMELLMLFYPVGFV